MIESNFVKTDFRYRFLKWLVWVLLKLNIVEVSNPRWHWTIPVTLSWFIYFLQVFLTLYCRVILHETLWSCGFVQIHTACKLLGAASPGLDVAYLFVSWVLIVTEMDMKANVHRLIRGALRNCLPLFLSQRFCWRMTVTNC